MSEPLATRPRVLIVDDEFSARLIMRATDLWVRSDRTMLARILNNLVVLNDLFPGRVSEEKLYYSEDYGKALDQGVPLLVWKGASSKTIDSMRSVFGEALKRIRDLAAQ